MSTDELEIVGEGAGGLLQSASTKRSRAARSVQHGQRGDHEGGADGAQALVAPLKAGGAARVVIGGYTDNVGEAKANLRLSRARANSVKVFLVKRGVNAKRLIARGYGETKPIAPNTTEAGRQKNRRIEFTVLGG